LPIPILAQIINGSFIIQKTTERSDLTPGKFFLALIKFRKMQIIKLAEHAIRKNDLREPYCSTDKTPLRLFGCDSLGCKGLQ